MQFLPFHEVLVVTWIAFLIFQNQSAAGNVIQLIKQEKP